MQLYIKSSLLTNSENSYEYTLSSLCYRGASKYDQAYAQCDYSLFGDKKKYAYKYGLGAVITG